jgi:hypothetical protein
VIILGLQLSEKMLDFDLFIWQFIWTRFCHFFVSYIKYEYMYVCTDCM